MFCGLQTSEFRLLLRIQKISVAGEKSDKLSQRAVTKKIHPRHVKRNLHSEIDCQLSTIDMNDGLLNKSRPSGIFFRDHGGDVRRT